jgi:hypothetical protein
MKKLILFIFIASLCLAFIFSFSLFGCNSDKEEREYIIGEKGPAGGIIFYINPNYQNDDWHYLEAAPADQIVSIMWFSEIMYNNENYFATGAKSTAVGTGKSNTQIIVNIQGEGIYAAQLCNDLELGGYDDWFLPSRDELNLMYENLHLKGLGGFNQNDGEEYYWSSSESADDDEVLYAWQQSFEDGDQEEDNKWYEYRVRAIRSFQ